MPARHTSLQDIPLLESGLQPGGSGRRKRVSARHQVKRLDRPFERARSCENRSGRRSQFSSFGADFWSAISSGSKPFMKSGPDVFADALVPLPWLSPARQLSRISQSKLSPSTAEVPEASAVTPGRQRSGPVAVTATGCEVRLPRMVIVSRNGRVNRIPEPASNPCQIGVLRFPGGPRGACIHLRFIAIFKLPFKFDRS